MKALFILIRCLPNWCSRLLRALAFLIGFVVTADAGEPWRLSTPLQLSSDGGSMVPDMAVDRFGSVHVVWRGADNCIWYAQVDTNATITLPARRVYDLVAGYPRIAVDAAGNAHVIATRSSFLVYLKIVGGVRTVLSGFWMYPVTLFESEYDFSPSIDINPLTQLPVVAAEAHGYYTIWVGSYPYTRYNDSIAALPLDAAGAPDYSKRFRAYYIENLSAPDYRATYAEVAVDSQGLAHCVWLHRAPDWTGSSVGYARDGDNAWIEIANARDVALGGGRPRVVRGASGLLDIVWSTTALATVWQEMDHFGLTVVDDTVVSGVGAQASRPHVGAGDGFLFYSWADKRSGGTNQIYARDFTGLLSETNATMTAGTAMNHALVARGSNALAISWQESQNGTNQVYYRTLERPTVIKLTVLDADNQGLAGCKGEYYAGGTLRWSKDTDSNGYTFDTNSTPATNAFCRARTLSAHIDVKDDDSGKATVQWDTTNFSTTGGGVYALTISLTNSSGTNASEASVAFREATRAWNFFNTGFSFARGLVTVNVDSAKGPECDGDNIYFPNNRARLRNGPPGTNGHIDDTILHEYSHAIQYSAYGNSWGIPAGHKYQVTDNHEWINGLTDPDCSYDALGEGWAEFLPVALYSAYNSSDTHYSTSPNSLAYEVNLEDGSGLAGTFSRTTADERNEFTVAMVFWDIFDAHNESGDNLSLGVFEIWDVLRNAKPGTFEEFFQCFISDAYYSQHAAALEQICVMNGMHPNWLTLSSSAVDFGQASTQQTFTIRRVGWYGDGVHDSVTPDWSITNNVAWITSVSPGNGATTTGTNTITVTIDRNALADGLNTGHLIVTPVHYGRAQVITVTATNLAPAIAVTPASLDFGALRVGTMADKTFNVQNTGGGTLTGSVSVASSPFAIVSGSTYSLGAGLSQPVTIRYSPPAGGSHNNNLTFTGGGGALRPVSGQAFSSTTDSDHDGMSDWDEVVAGTDPNNSQSRFILSVPPTGARPPGGNGLIVQWPSVSNRIYHLDRSTNLAVGFNQSVASNLPAMPPMNTHTDTTATARANFYRIRVERQ